MRGEVDCLTARFLRRSRTHGFVSQSGFPLLRNFYAQVAYKRYCWTSLNYYVYPPSFINCLYFINARKLRDSGNPIYGRFVNVLFANFDLLELLHSQSFPAFLTATNNFVPNWTSLILICDPPVVTISFSFKGNNHQSTNHFSGLVSAIRGLPASTTVDFILIVNIRSYQSLSLAFMYYWQAVEYGLILKRSSSLAATHSLPSTL